LVQPQCYVIIPGISLAECFLIIFAAMKIIFTILTLLFFSLSSVACDSNEACCEETEQASVDISKSHSEHGQDKGCCDSLCDCSCCGIPVIITETIKLPAHKNILSKRIYYNFNTAPGSEVFYPIWEPPKI